jgi:AcrR family transcriptional regulator
MAPRNVIQNKQILDERREQILKAALKVFANRGFVGAKISDIAAEASLSHGLVYHYFESKEALFTELARNAIKGSNETIIMTDTLPGSAYNKIKLMTAAMLDTFATSNEASYYFYLMLQAATLDSIPGEVKELMQKESVTVKKLEQLLEQGQLEGEIILKDPYMLTLSYWSFIEGLVLMNLQIGEAFVFPKAEVVLRIIKK